MNTRDSIHEDALKIRAIATELEKLSVHAPRGGDANLEAIGTGYLGAMLRLERMAEICKLRGTAHLGI